MAAVTLEQRGEQRSPNSYSKLTAQGQGDQQKSELRDPGYRQKKKANELLAGYQEEQPSSMMATLILLSYLEE